MKLAKSNIEKRILIILVCQIGCAAHGSFLTACQAKSADHSHARAGVQEKLELGDMLLYNGSPRAAASAFEDAIRLDPDSLGAHIQLVEIYGRLHEPSKQVPQLKEIARLKPDDTDVQVSLANALIADGKFDEAIERLKTCLANAKTSKVTTDTKAVKLTLAFAFLDKGAFSESAATFDELPEAADPNILLAQAMCNLKLGKMKESEKFIDRAIEMRTPNAEAHCLRGDLKYAEGNKEEAIKEYEIAAKDAPDSGQPPQSLGDLYLREQEYLKSRNAYLRANKLKQRNADILCGLAMTYEKLGDVVSALTIYKEAVKYETSEEHKKLIHDHVSELKLVTPATDSGLAPIAAPLH